MLFTSIECQMKTSWLNFGWPWKCRSRSTSMCTVCHILDDLQELGQGQIDLENFKSVISQQPLQIQTCGWKVNEMMLLGTACCILDNLEKLYWFIFSFNFGAMFPIFDASASYIKRFCVVFFSLSDFSKVYHKLETIIGNSLKILVTFVCFVTTSVHNSIVTTSGTCLVKLLIWICSKLKSINW